MKLHTKPGELVRFNLPNGGYESDHKQCRTHGLEVGQTYEVVKVRRGAFMSTVELRGFRDIQFNTVHFKTLQKRMRSISLIRDEAEILTELLLLVDDRRATDLDAELRKLFGMCDRREQLSRMKMTILEARKKEIEKVNVTDLKQAEQYAL